MELSAIEKEEKQKNKTSKRKKSSLLLIAHLLKQPRELLIVILTGNLFVNIFLSTVSTNLAIELFGSYGPLVAIALLTPVIIVMAEILPKNLAITTKKRFAAITARPIYYFGILIFPLKIFLSSITNLFFRFFHLHEENVDNLSRDELASSIKMSQRAGIIATEESRYILNLLKMEKREAQHVMIPRNETVFIKQNATVHQALEKFQQHPVSILPVYKDSRDHIQGFIFLKDIAPLPLLNSKTKSISRLVHPAHFFPYRMDLIELLQEFRTLGIRVAILLDEYGGTAGIVTLKDIISFIMGFDPHLDPEQKIRKINRNTYYLTGDLLLDDFNEKFAVKIHSDFSETINGFLLENFGQIPMPGDSLIFQKARFTVVRMEENKIESVLFRGKRKI